MNWKTDAGKWTQLLCHPNFLHMALFQLCQVAGVVPATTVAPFTRALPGSCSTLLIAPSLLVPVRFGWTCWQPWTRSRKKTRPRNNGNTIKSVAGDNCLARRGTGQIIKSKTVDGDKRQAGSAAPCPGRTGQLLQPPAPCLPASLLGSWSGKQPWDRTIGKCGRQ